MTNYVISAEVFNKVKEDLDGYNLNPNEPSYEFRDLEVADGDNILFMDGILELKYFYYEEATNAGECETELTIKRLDVCCGEECYENVKFTVAA